MPLLSNANPNAPENETGGMSGSLLSLGAVSGAGSEPFFIGRCSNPGCRSGWLQLFRKRTRPVFEEGWTCSADCTEARLQLSVRRELAGWQQVQEIHRHRIPLGLLMLEKGWITPHQLRRAVEEQRRSGELRIGEWLVKQGAAEEAQIARGLSLQWGCPVLSLSNGGMAGSNEVLPRLFVDAFGALPLLRSSGKIAYLGFEQSLDPILAFAVERMSGIRVESGIVQSSVYAGALGKVREQAFPALQLAEAASDFAAARLLAKAIERAHPISSRLVRVHEWLWLRMILQLPRAGSQISACMSDVVCRIGTATLKQHAGQPIRQAGGEDA